MTRADDADDVFLCQCGFPSDRHVGLFHVPIRCSTYVEALLAYELRRRWVEANDGGETEK